jgi:hypothetical protein
MNNPGQRWWLNLCLVALLGGIYLLAYRGFPISQDEAALFSATESLYKYQTLQLISLYHEYPFEGDPYLAVSPWQDSVHEPLHNFISLPLYAIAHELGTPGMLHTVWLFNIFVMLGVGLVLYHGGVWLGYSSGASWLTAFLTGVGSMVFPYSQTYFREPLFALLLLITFILAFRLKQTFRIWLVMAVLLALVVAAFTKIVALMAIPALVVILLPDDQRLANRRAMTRLLVVSLILAVLLVIGFFLLNRLFPDNDRLDPRNYLERARRSNLGYLRTVIGAYLFSPGRSIWATSPILLLSLYGAWLAFKAKQYRFAFVPLILLVTTALGYGFGGWEWHGGRGWGTRYLLHVVPVMGLLLLPVFQSTLEKKISRPWLILMAVLVIFSILVQLGGVLVPLDSYYDAVSAAFPDNPVKAFYDQGTWQIQYTQPYLALKSFDLGDLDVAWSFTAESWRGLVVGGLLLMLGMTLFALAYCQKIIPAWRWGFTGAFMVLMTLGYGFALSGLADDQRMLADRPASHQLVEAAESQVGADDILFLSDPIYRDLFLNFYRGEGVLVTLPYPPGERYSYEQTPLVITDNPDERINMPILYPLHYAAENFQTIWLVEAQGPFHPWAYRPVEHYLTRHFYQVESREDIAANARLIRFAPLPAPSYDYLYDTLYITDHDPFQFGDHISLNGYNLPAEVQAGSVLPVSLKWESEGQVGFDYNVGIFLINREGVLVAARNVQPQGTFGFTSLWEAGVPQGDNHGLAIPTDLPAGTYTVQVVMYDWRDATRLPVTLNGKRIDGDYAEIGTMEILSP